MPNVQFNIRSDCYVSYDLGQTVHGATVICGDKTGTTSYGGVTLMSMTGVGMRVVKISHPDFVYKEFPVLVTSDGLNQQPIVVTKYRDVIGKVFHKRNGINHEINDATVTISDKNGVIATTITDSTGGFDFTSIAVPLEHYVLSVVKGSRSGSEVILIKSDPNNYHYAEVVISTQENAGLNYIRFH